MPNVRTTPDPGDPLSKLPVADRPRERLERLGVSGLSDAEVLALVLGSGRPGLNVVALAHALLAQVGGFAGLTALDLAQLQGLTGVGPASASRMIAAVEMCRRAGAPLSGRLLTDAESLARLVLPELADRPDERFVVVIADRAQRAREVVVLRAGPGSRHRTDANDVIQSVLARGGGAFAVAHNHPGGSAEPSVADVALTRRVSAAGRAVGVRFLGHLVVAGAQWRSVEPGPARR